MTLSEKKSVMCVKERCLRVSCITKHIKVKKSKLSCHTVFLKTIELCKNFLGKTYRHIIRCHTETGSNKVGELRRVRSLSPKLLRLRTQTLSRLQPRPSRQTEIPTRTEKLSGSHAKGLRHETRSEEST